jgi:hypothetical protein
MRVSGEASAVGDARSSADARGIDAKLVVAKRDGHDEEERSSH